MTRQEHLDWCKKRALEILDSGDMQEAIASMLSDMGKHEETAPAMGAMAPLAMFELMNPTDIGIRRFIEGFN